MEEHEIVCSTIGNITRNEDKIQWFVSKMESMVIILNEQKVTCLSVGDKLDEAAFSVVCPKEV